MVVGLINLEAGMPTVEQALALLEMELARAKRDKLKAVKLIHGYGSTGTGGRIKPAVHRVLAEKVARKAIKCFIPGESWTMFNLEATVVTDACPELRKDRDREQYNNGITIVLL